jgi:predicted ester cyclase
MSRAKATIISGAIMLGGASLSPPVLANEAVDLVRALYQAVDAQDRGTYAKMIADDFVDHDRPASAPENLTDAEVIIGHFDALGAAFPDATHKLDLLEPIRPDETGNPRAMVRWTFEGTHTGEFYGIPASGRAVSINGIDIFTTRSGAFIEQWHVEELIDLFAQTRTN